MQLCLLFSVACLHGALGSFKTALQPLLLQRQCLAACLRAAAYAFACLPHVLLYSIWAAWEAFISILQEGDSDDHHQFCTKRTTTCFYCPAWLKTNCILWRTYHLFWEVLCAIFIFFTWDCLQGTCLPATLPLPALPHCCFTCTHTHLPYTTFCTPHTCLHCCLLFCILNACTCTCSSFYCSC